MFEARALRGVILGLFVLALGLAGERSARAQGNALSAPTGGRSTLMGNTGVALARDGSAPFLNPATIVRINDNSLAFSVNFYSFGATTFSGWHQPGSVDTARFGNVALNDTSISTNGFRIFPSTLCLFFTVRGVTAQGVDDGGLHRGRQKLAICFGSTEFDDVEMPALGFNGATPLGLTAQTQSVSRHWNRFQAGPTYSWALTDDFSVGLSLHGVYTSESFVLASSSITSVTGGGAVQSSLDVGGLAHAFDLTAILGAAFHRGRYTLGASAQLPSFHMFGNYNATLHSEYGLAGVDTATLSTGNGNFSASPPMRFALGLGAEWSRLAMELDASVQVPTSSISSFVSGTTTTLMGTTATSAPVSAIYFTREHPAFNPGIGAEYFVSKSFSLVGGASTSLTTLPALSPTVSLANLVQARQSSASLSFGIGSYGGGSDLLIGTQLGFAWGQTLAVNPYVLPNEWSVIDTRSYSVMLVLAGATDLRSLGRAVEKVEKAVTTGDPELTPATPTKGPKQPPKPTEPNRELPRSGDTDPRNAVDPDTGRPVTPKPTPSGSANPPQPPQPVPGQSIDPKNRSFPPR